MEDNRPYVKRINLGIDTRNPDYKKAYDYIMEHKGGKFRFICDCVLQVMEGRIVQEQQHVPKASSPDLLSMISANPEVLQSLAQAVAQIMPNVQTVEEVTAPEQEEEIKETVTEPVYMEPVSAYPNEEKKDDDGYDGPVLDMDMLAGISAWDEFLE